MPQTFFIRCTENDRYVVELVDTIQRIVPDARVYAVPDLMKYAPDEVSQRVQQFDLPTLPITQEFLQENGLGYYGNKTGWRCGDYVAYRGLSEDWDQAWIIEPDVKFLNGAERILTQLEEDPADLVCRLFRKAGEGWWWRRGMNSLFPDLDVFGMEFCILRVSRRLTEEALAFRREIGELLTPGVQVPNDEAVFATVAGNGEYAVTDLKTVRPDLLSYWHTDYKYPVDDLARAISVEKIVHSGLHREDFLDYLVQVWRDLSTDAAPKARRRIERSLSAASEETKDEFLCRIIDDRCAVMNPD